MNIRVIALQECRIEYYEPQSFTLIAIDENGDGDFVDAGDVLYRNADASDVSDTPKLNPDPVQNIGFVEFQVFPKNDSPRISFSLEIKTGKTSDWSILSVDELVLEVRE